MSKRDIVERLRDNSGGHINGLYDIEAANEIERLRAAIAAQQAAPDSHGRYWLENRGRIIDALTRAGFQLMSDANGFWLAPLAAAPSAQQAAQPLTDERIQALRGKLGAAASLLSTPTLREIVRATEAAHGIAAEQPKQASKINPGEQA